MKTGQKPLWLYDNQGPLCTSLNSSRQGGFFQYHENSSKFCPNTPNTFCDHFLMLQKKVTLSTFIPLKPNYILKANVNLAPAGKQLASLKYLKHSAKKIYGNAVSFQGSVTDTRS